MPPPTILVVDDSPTLRALLERRLTAAHYRVAVATTGEEALVQLRQVGPDLVLLDILLPGIDGLEVCRRLRANPRTARLPIVLLSTLDTLKARIAAFRAGADDYLVKDADLSDLLYHIQLAFRLRAPGSVPPQPAPAAAPSRPAPPVPPAPAPAGAGPLRGQRPWQPLTTDAEWATLHRTLTAAQDQHLSFAFVGPGIHWLAGAWSRPGGEPPGASWFWIEGRLRPRPGRPTEPLVGGEYADAAAILAALRAWDCSGWGTTPSAPAREAPPRREHAPDPPRGGG
jgi:CheY-like chemotaxis protein